MRVFITISSRIDCWILSSTTQSSRKLRITLGWLKIPEDIRVVPDDPLENVLLRSSLRSAIVGMLCVRRTVWYRKWPEVHAVEHLQVVSSVLWLDLSANTGTLIREQVAQLTDNRTSDRPVKRLNCFINHSLFPAFDAITELTVAPRILYTDTRWTIVDETVSSTTDSLLPDMSTISLVLLLLMFRQLSCDHLTNSSIAFLMLIPRRYCNFYILPFWLEIAYSRTLFRSFVAHFPKYSHPSPKGPSLRRNKQ